MASTDSPFKTWNVVVLNLSTVLFSLMGSITQGSTFDAYLLELAKTRGESENYANLFVGSVESVSGMVSLIFALPIGIVADKVVKRRFLQSSTIIGIFGVVASCGGILWDKVPLIYTGVVILALQGQVLMSSFSAVLADSVPPQHLQKVVATNGSLGAMGYGAGPVVQMAVIFFVGNTWNMRELHIFCVAGFVLYPALLPALCAIKPTRLELEREQRSLNQALSPQAAGGAPCEAEGTGTGLAAMEASGEAPVIETRDQWKEDTVFGIKKKWFVPLLIEFSSLITACGAGMTVKFFPLFFKEDYGFNPMAFCALSAASIFAVAFFVQVFQKVGEFIGILPSALLCHVLGTGCLFLLWKVENMHLCVLVFILRGGIMNAGGPIDSAIVLACVDSQYRGRWSALQTITSFSWAGSAAIGGWLADTHDYRYTFLITGVIYSISAVLYSPLLAIVPSHVGRKEPPASTADVASEG